MKIKCEFCGAMLDDTQERCPACGAPNKNVRRSSGDQPLTVAELKQWYQSKGLPDESVTRFFIGKDVREPRAFGIYYEESTGNFVVYKNKASGERVVRYRGTDEAYAVNELFQRLKEEIIQQKMLNVQKSQAALSGAKTAEKAKTSQAGERAKGCLGNFLALLTIGGIITVCFFVFLVVLGLFLTRNDPSTGYYTYSNTDYYYSSTDYGGLNWFRYSSSDGEWEGPLTLDAVPDELETRKQSKAYYLQEKWDPALQCSDFLDSTFAKDIQMGARTESGYYRCDSGFYYHLTGIYDDDWYYYSDDTWQSLDYGSLPESLQRPSTARDFYYTPTWDAETQLTDFEDSDAYREAVQNASGETQSDSDSDFNWDSNDSWDSGDTDWDSDW